MSRTRGWRIQYGVMQGGPAAAWICWITAAR